MAKSEDENIMGNYPLLRGIDSPADLRALSVEELPQLCAELRQFMIEKLSVNPGHFASSMGSVEITVALHYVYDTPYDRLVWDVGHQAYSHKILTGRREAFATQRTLGGISGFPTPSESEYDTFTAGHASNAISAALGMAAADKLKKSASPRRTVAITGDASISGGLSFEGMNNAADIPNNLLIVLNDNDMSIDHNVGSLNSYLAHLTTSRGYNNLRLRIYRFLRKIHLISERQKGPILRFNNSLKSLFSRQQNIFEGLNIRYFGPFDGHDVKTLVKVFKEIKDMEGPRILHLRTQKGKGYKMAEEDPSVWHAPGKFDPLTGERMTGGAKEKKYQDIFGDALLEIARVDNGIVGITAAMPSGTSISTLQKEMPERVFDVGISEGHAVTFAGGLAKEGLKPVVAIYSSFLQRAYDQIIHDVAIEGLHVTFCIDRAGVVGEDGVTHHGSYDLSYLRSVPGLTICAPSDGLMLRDMLYTALEFNSGPMAIRYPRGADKSWNGEREFRKIEIGRGEKIKSAGGKADVALLFIGALKDEVLSAAERLESSGVKTEVCDMRFLKPLDTVLLDETVRNSANIITVEDGVSTGGLGGAVAEWMAENGVGVPLKRLGIGDKFVTHGTVSQLKKLCGYDSDAIVEAAREMVEKHKTFHK